MDMLIRIKTALKFKGIQHSVPNTPISDCIPFISTDKINLLGPQPFFFTYHLFSEKIARYQIQWNVYIEA